MPTDSRPGLGTTILPDGKTSVRVWAPRVKQLSIEIVGATTRTAPLERGPHDLFEATLEGLGAGTDYVFILDGDKRRPDPTSRHQPHGVHGASRVVDPAAFQWSDPGWRGLPLADHVLYELHVGTFTEAGTFEAVIDKLGHLREAGINAIELMPVAEFPGRRNWGYDGVHLYAPQSTYGGPTGMKKLVDACHAQGIAVVLDVVYNHLGPEGNYLGDYAPYFSDRYRTPWGDAVNFDGPDSDGVRRHFIDNALHWLVDYHVDGLRLDAIHGIYDFSARHVLEELQTAFRERAAALGRRAHLIAESDLNDVRVLRASELGGHGIDAQWSDDFHHAVRTALTGDRRGYFEDFGAIADIEKAVTDGFVYDGRYSKHRRRRHGSKLDIRTRAPLVVSLQTHDQIANASNGARIASLLDLDRQKLAAVSMFVTPDLPMLFMGEEFGEVAPFHYFIDHSDPELVRAVVTGRRKEYEAFDGEAAFADPSSPATFEASRLDWARAASAPGTWLLALYRDLVALRSRTPALSNGRRDLTRASSSDADGWLVVERAAEASGAAIAVFNLSDVEREIPISPPARPLALALATDAVRYGGTLASGPPSPPPGPTRHAVRCPPRAARIYTDGADR